MERWQKVFFFLLLILIPTQLGRHFWPGWTQVLGLRIDYLSPTIYFTDLLLILLFLFCLPSFLSLFKKNPHRYLWLGAPCLILLGGGIITAQNPTVGFYQLAKWVEFGFFGFYLVKTIRNYSQFQKITFFLSLGVIFESSLALGQFLHQGSIGGLFWWLGERTFSGQTLGIARAAIGGELLLRPYGTFPHPNVLAGYLVVMLALIVGISQEHRFGQYVKWLAIVLGILALFFTFSRSAWIVGLGVVLFWLITQRKWLPFFLTLLVMIAGFGSAQSRFQTLLTTDQESWQRRQELNLAATEMIKNRPLLGVGLGNFLVQLPFFHEERQAVRFLQPAHNVYLMIGAEAGLLILTGFLALLFFTYKKLFSFTPPISLPLFIALSAILTLSLVDHYFYTLQQGRLLLALLLGLSWSSLDSPSHKNPTPP